MYEHSNYYPSFHGDGSTRSMLKQAEEFLLCGKYILNIADACVVATANYLHMNLYIFENLGGKPVIIQQRSAIEKATKGLFLHFTHKPNGIGHENHYDAIVETEIEPKFQPEIPEFDKIFNYQIVLIVQLLNLHTLHPLIFQKFYLNHRLNSYLLQLFVEGSGQNL